MRYVSNLDGGGTSPTNFCNSVSDTTSTPAAATTSNLLMEQPAAAAALTNNHGNGNYGYDIIAWFEHLSENPGFVQRETLRRILQQNSQVEYLKKLLGDTKIEGMDACALESLYTSLVPLASHADLEPYIRRIADGDTAPLLTQQPITTLSLRWVHYTFFLLLSLFLYYFITLLSSAIFHAS